MKTKTKLSALPAVTIMGGLLAMSVANAVGATTVNLTVTPDSPIFDSKDVVGVPGDAAPGYDSSSIASGGTGKTDMYFTPDMLFGRAVTLGEIARFSYWTKTGATHTVDPRDWYVAIYTKPYSGDVSSASWYGDRIGCEPYFSENLSDPPNTWNQWSTDGANNRLRFFESTAGYFGSYTDPDWATFVSGNALSGDPYADHDILYFSIQTGSAWAAGFTGQLDGLRIELTDGSVATVNFEADSDGDGVGDGVDHCPNSDLRSIVDVNGDEPGETSIVNTVDAEGCSIQDLVNTCADAASNHGQYVSCINELANELYGSEVITKSQRQEMITGAARSSVGK